MAKSDDKAAVPTQKKSNKQQGSKEKQKPPTKIVIRHLPPTMSEEEFLKQIDPLPVHDFYYFAAADWSLGFDATCRAYITLKNYDDVFLFRDRFDGYVFVDAKGGEYAAIVEFAPFQGLLKNKSRRTDNKVNSIEEETHYQEFLVKLAEEREFALKGGECKLEFNLNTKKEEITSTPLLQYLANKKEKRRQDSKKRIEEKRRQRDDEKDKRSIASSDKGKEPQITRIMSGNATIEKRHDEGEQKKEQASAGENSEKQQSSRYRRRNERNKKRHEAYMQRKINEKAGKTGETLSVEPENAVEKAEESENKARKSEENAEQYPLKMKDNKLNDRKRERDRERNRKRRERIRERYKTTDSIKSETKYERQNSGNERKLSQSLKEMPILLVKEGTQRNIDQTSTVESIENKADQEQKQRASEERRIRNKDRPSIAIYQPKIRIRQSEESDTGCNSAGGGRQSDGERGVDPPKSEEVQRPKKVSRYSERRNERQLAKEKRKSSVTDEEILTLPKDTEAVKTDNQ